MRWLWLGVMACAEGPGGGGEADLATCNGLPGLCERRVNEVSYLRTHNSHASEERGYTQLSWNHYFAIPTQLRDGVRSLNVDVYPADDGSLRVCHGFCELGEQPFVEVLDEIEAFLDAWPREVVLLDFQIEVPAEDLRAALMAHPLHTRALTQAPGTPWPTLGELVDADRRLVVFGSGDPEDPPWLLAKSAFMYTTGWSYWEPEDLDCAITSDQLEHGLYEVTHVLTNPLASPYNAEAINSAESIDAHLERCDEEVGFVNLLSVDFYTIGEPLAAIGARNAGLTEVGVSPRGDGLRPRP